MNIDFNLIQAELKALDNSLDNIIAYFQENLDLNAVLIFKDTPHKITRKHFHIQDSYLFILKGGMSLDFTGKVSRLVADDFKFIPKNYYHSSKIDPEDCTYVIANKNGDFEKIFY